MDEKERSEGIPYLPEAGEEGVYVRSISPEELEEAIRKKDKDQLEQILEQVSEVDVGAALSELDPSLIIQLFRLLPNEVAAPLFDDLVDNVLVKAYMNYSSMAASASYSTFSKTDTIYYRDVAVFVWKYFRSKPVIPERCLATDIMVATRPDLSDPMLDAYPGLETELSIIGQEGVEGRGKSQPALTSMQIVSIVRYMPHDLLALSTKCNLGQKVISAYGRHILRLVSKYESRCPEAIDNE